MRLAISIAAVLLAGASVSLAISNAVPRAGCAIDRRSTAVTGVVRAGRDDEAARSTFAAGAVAEAIKREGADQYPADIKLMGDWKAGDKIAPIGLRLRFSDIRRATRTAATATPAIS
jgi:hypothetical protein